PPPSPLLPYTTLFRSTVGAPLAVAPRLTHFRLMILEAAGGYKLAGAVNDILHRLCPSCAYNFIPATGPIKTQTIGPARGLRAIRSEEHTSELQSLRHL